MIWNDILHIVIITLTPLLELRASIPYGIIATDLPLIVIFSVAVISNVFMAFIAYWFMNAIIKLITKLRFFNEIYERYKTRIQEKIHSSVEKYGQLGMALFIGIPIPMSGVVSGALGAHLIGMKMGEFIKAAVIGVLISATLVTLVAITGVGIVDFFKAAAETAVNVTTL